MLDKNERIDIIPGTNLKLIQDKTKFCYGIDAILLSFFSKAKKSDVVVDLGTGTGIIPLRMASRYNLDKVYGVEIQEDMAKMAERSVSLNNMDEKVKILNMDLNDLSKKFERNSVDVITSNPPYMKEGAGILNPNKSVSIARHEIYCNIEDIIRESSIVLREGKGKLYLIHRPNRLVDIFYLGRKYRLEPKRACFVHPSQGKSPNLVLVELVKYGQEELILDEPINVYNKDGSYTDKIHSIYDRKDECND